MFAPISAILSLLFFPSTLSNGIRLVELPPAIDSLEIVAGYAAGGLRGFASGEAARNLTRTVYAAGGTIEFFQEIDRTGVRISAPRWSLPMFTGSAVADLFREVPAERPAERAPPAGFREKVEEEIHNALLGPIAAAPPPYATGTAFVLISEPPGSLREHLESIPRRAGTAERPEPLPRLPAERTLRFQSESANGAVIFASPIPGVHYRQWYLVLLLDRIIRRTVPLDLTTALPLTIQPYYYRMELRVPPGQFPEPAEENFLQEIQRLQFTPANSQQLAAARQECLTYLDSPRVREWFASQDIAGRRDEGKQWIVSITADDLRAAARDLLIMNRVVATWPPLPRQTEVAVESLSDGNADSASRGTRESTAAAPRNALANRPSPAFPAHTHEPISPPAPEILSSGVSLVPAASHAVFVSGASMTRFDQEPGESAMNSFQSYRPDRILVLAPPSSIGSARALWTKFKGGNSDAEIGVPRGGVSPDHLVALFVLKTILDLRLIEAGWWNSASVRINANEVSPLEIRADAATRFEILNWIKQIAAEGPGDEYFVWVREVALHRLETALTDLLALRWERDAQGRLQDIETVTPTHVQDVARLYF